MGNVMRRGRATDPRVQEFAKFLLVGLANTAVGLSIIYTAKFFFGAGDVLANAIGYGVGVLFSFSLNSSWTFTYSGPWLPTLMKFIIVSGLAYVLNLVTVVVLIDYFEINSYLAQAMGIPPYTLTVYLASRYLVFRRLSMTSGS